jgi:hypothetical protein
MTNPLEVSVRPSESAVQYALKLLSGNGAGKKKKAVRLSNLGEFSKKSLELYMKACSVADSTVKVKEEQAWLSEPSDVAIKDLLMNANPHTEILMYGCYIMDAREFSTLVGERYLKICNGLPSKVQPDMGEARSNILQKRSI